MIPTPRHQPSQTWRTFLNNHVRDIVSLDFFTVPTAGLRVLFVLVATQAMAHERLHTRLSGYEEVPSVSTTARGEFRAKVSSDESPISWSLTYAESDVQQAHIHLAQTGVNGGITVFLCTNLGNGPAGTQGCPPTPATITGTIFAADVSPDIPATAPARTQGLGTGEFAELLAAIRAGATYVNVHSTTWSTGEIRGQLDGPNRGN